MNELISLIVPVYNAEEYLGKCVESLLEQTYRNFELILVNDGSSDNSLDICKRYEQRDQRVKVIHQENKGASAARNAGLKVANGQYIVFADSDDYVSNNYLNNLYNAAKSENYDIVQCGYEVVHGPKVEETNEVFSVSHVKEISKIQALNGRMYKVTIWGKIYRACVFNDFRFKEGIIYEDDDSYYKFVYQAKKIAILQENLYFYYMSENSVMRNNKNVKSTDFINIYNERISYFKDREEIALLHGSYARFCIVLLLFYVGCRRKKNNRNDLQEILRLFDENYQKIKNSRFVSLKEKIMFVLFKTAPNMTSYLIGKLRK